MLEILQKEVSLQLIFTSKRSILGPRSPLRQEMVPHVVAEMGQRADAGEDAFSQIAQARHSAGENQRRVDESLMLGSLEPHPRPHSEISDIQSISSTSSEDDERVQHSVRSDCGTHAVRNTSR